MVMLNKIKKENKMKRAYNIKIYGKTVEVVGGEKAGRFAYGTPTKPRKRTTSRSRAKQSRIKALFIPLFMIWIAIGCTATAETIKQMKPKEKVEIVETAKAEEPVEPVKPVEETIEQKITRIFGADSERAIKIFTCESNLDPNVIGDLNTKYPSVGVAQIRMLPERNLQVKDMLDPDKNLEYAKLLFNKSGWEPWACRGVK